MVRPEQELKYKECLQILDEIQHILAATIALDTVTHLPALDLVEEAVKGIKMLAQMSPAEQDKLLNEINSEMEQQARTQSKEKKLVSTTKQGKVVIH